MLNKVFLVGKIQDTPKTYGTETGKTVARLTVITEKQIPGRDPIKAFHRVVAWNKAAEDVKQMGKGTLVSVDGEMSYGSYEKDGVKRYTADIQAFKIQVLDGTLQKADDTPPAILEQTQAFTSDDIPF